MNYRFAVIITAISAVLLSSDRHIVADDTPMRGVVVAELPAGEREIVGYEGFGSHYLRLSANGTLVSWTDRESNRHFMPMHSSTSALEVTDAANRNVRLFPSDGQTLEIRKSSADETLAVVTRPDGLRLVYVIEPQRIGVRVEGPSQSYAVTGRNLCRAEGCRVVAGDRQWFASADLGQIDAPRQMLIDSRRSQALVIEPPKGVPLDWRLAQTDGWAMVTEHVAWTAGVRTGETLWLSSSPVAPLTGPVSFGLFPRRLFRPEGGPSAIATMSSHRLTANAPVALSLSKPVEQILKDGTLLAALLPVDPNDPIDDFEQGAWYFRFDRFSQSMIPVELKANGGEWSLRPRPETAPGVYRLRVWVAPKEAPRPAALGGEPDSVAPYFPGFEGRASFTRQSTAVGDVLVAIPGPTSGSLAVVTPNSRAGFWRGEPIPLVVRGRGSDGTVAARLTVRERSGGIVVADTPIKISIANGHGTVELRVGSESFAPGEYEAAATADGLATYPLRFAMTGVAVSGMPVMNSPLTGPHDFGAYSRLGVNLWVDVMPGTGGSNPEWPTSGTTGRLLRSAEPSLAQSAPPKGGEQDELVRHNWTFLQGVQSRQISFAIHHSVEEQVDETLRKHLIYAQFQRRFPSMLGLVFDYDLAGTGPGDGFSATYIKAGQRRMELLNKRWEAAWADAQKNGATEADRPRLLGLFHAEVIADIYRRSQAQLHDALPEQRHTSAVTADHNDLSHGQYLPAVYRPLDLRYLEVWNDQIYPNGAHEMQESFWTSLLRMEKPAGQPLWVTVPTAQQPGTHFRRTLEAVSRGATATGYNAEGAAGLTGGWGPIPERSEIAAAKESLTGTLAREYGTWLNAFEPAEEIAILYSLSQGGTNYGLQSPVFFAYYTLAQLNRPARLLTEDEIAAGALRDVKALVVVKQTAKLPPATVAAIEKFAQSGQGKVLCDADTKIELAGSIKLDQVAWPGGLWPNGGNRYHDLIASAARNNSADLVAALGDAGKPVLTCDNGHALVVEKRGPAGASLLFVANNREYPFDELFSADQRLGSFFRTFQWRGSTYRKDVRIPTTALLTLRADRSSRPPRIFDVFDGRELQLEKKGAQSSVAVDLSRLSGRVLLLTDGDIPSPEISVGARAESDPRATLVVRNTVPLPIRIRVGSEVFYRAATPTGSCDTVAIGPAAGETAIEVTELVTGATLRGKLKLAAPKPSAVAELHTVQVWDADRIRSILKAPGAAVYVDARQAGRNAAALRLAQQLGAEIVFNPTVHNFPIGWDLPAADEAGKESVLRTRQLGWRQPAENYLQWTGALNPAPRWDRPVILFGHSGNNRLIEALDSVTLLSRPASAESIGAGRAIVEPVAAPFSNGYDAVVILCSDDLGMQQAFDRVAEIAKGGNGQSLSTDDDGGARQERRRVLGFEPNEYPAKLTPLVTQRGRSPVGLTPVIPVNFVAAIEDGVIATLMNPGKNIAHIGRDGTVRWRTMTAGFYQPASLSAQSAGGKVAGGVVAGDGTFIWRHDGSGAVLWKSLGTAVSPIMADGSLWAHNLNDLRRIDAAGVVQDALTLTGNVLGVLPDGRRALVVVPGDAKQGRLKADSATTMVELPGLREIWKVPNMQAVKVQVNDDATVVACIENENMAGRDDLDQPDASRLTVLDLATGSVLFRRPLGSGLSDLQISRDGKRLAVGEAAFSDALLVIDVPANRVRRVVLPERGAWARLLEADGRQMWIAGERLYRVTLDALHVEPTLNRRVLCLARRPEGGVYTGTPEGSVLFVGPNGKPEREIELTTDLASDELAPLMANLRKAKDVASGSLNPHLAPCTIPLADEYPISYMVRADGIVPRGDGIIPPQVAVRIPIKGRYRLKITLLNSKSEADILGGFRLNRPGVPGPLTTAFQNDRWQQAADLDLDPGAYQFELFPEGWKGTPYMQSLEVSKVAP